MKISTLLGAALFVGSVLCTPISSAKDDPLASLEKYDNFAWDSLSFINPESLAGIRSIAEVTSSASSSFVHDGEAWVEEVITFRGLKVWFIHKKGIDTSGLITKVEISTAKYEMPCGIKVGVARAVVTKCLGAPGGKNPSKAEYSGVSESFEVHYTPAGNVAKVVFFVYTG